MENDKLKVYAESSIFSYLTGHLVKDKLVMFRKILTHVWWDNEKPKCALFVSQHVVDEAGDGDPKEAAKRLELVREILQVDGLNAIVLDLAQKLIDGFAVPATEGTDALHIATAAYHGMDGQRRCVIPSYRKSVCPERRYSHGSETICIACARQFASAKSRLAA